MSVRLSKLIRVVSKHLCQISAAFNCTAVASACLFPLPWWPPWRKLPQTGYELMPEYGFCVNFRCFHQRWLQSEVFLQERWGQTRPLGSKLSALHMFRLLFS